MERITFSSATAVTINVFQCQSVNSCPEILYLWFASYVQIMSRNQPHCLSNFPTVLPSLVHFIRCVISAWE